MPGPASIKNKITLNVQEAIRIARLRDEALKSIKAKYESLGGPAFGQVTRREFGAWYLSPGACICYNSTMKASYEIHGAIYEKWMEFRARIQKWSFTNEFPLLKFMAG